MTTTTNTAISSNSKNGNQDPGLYFIDVARQYSSPVGGETELEPTELNTVKCSGGFLVVSSDKLRVKYTNVNHHGHNVGVIQADRPAPEKRLVYYFEIYVKNAGAKGQIAIGFTNHSFNMRRQPGWEANSCGYHGDDGNLYRGSGTGEAFGPAFTTNDTVGAGINYASQEFFFTKNGAVVGAVYKDIKGLLLPTVAVHSQNEEYVAPLLTSQIEVNFGKKSFAFDLKARYPFFCFILIDFFSYFSSKEYERQEVMKQQMAADKISLPPIVSYELVRSYLLHNGYEETLKAFDVASKNTIPSIYIAQENGFGEQHIAYALAQRKAVRQLIRNGEIDSALSKLHEWYPQIVQDEKSATCFLLHSQKFIELVRAGALEEAVHYGRIELAKFFKLPGFDDLVRDCAALLAYEQPHQCSAGYLLEESQREIVADAVNGMILLTDPNVKDAQSCLRSHLERLLRQLTVCCLERRSLNGDQGEGFHLHRALNTSTAGRGPSANTLV
uniref:B30.2/SPRY domain-containing protein n=1 Tax=Salix viminalis TaxID=40686 RepID=A0A6N2MAI2_SALVM